MIAADSARSVPLRALVLSAASLAVPVIGSLAFPEWATEDYGTLLWMTALVPAFLLTYYRGWRGASTALALGMAALSTTQVAILLLGAGLPDWRVLAVLVTVYVGLCFGIGYLAELLHRERRAAEQVALTDPVTGLPNRRHADIFLRMAVASADRGLPVSVAVFDLDHFKRFNDQFGHAAGDRVLRAFGDVLADSTRKANLTARWGGEEFLSVLTDCDLEGALIFAERVRSGLAALDLPWGSVTVSVGVAEYDPSMASTDVVVAAADTALYAAKRKGRDRVERAPQAPEIATREDRHTKPGPAPPSPSPARLARVLVVDDEAGSRRAVRRLLERLGHRVTEAESGRRALEILGAREPVDLLVTDIIMPDVNGLTLVERASETRPDIPVLYMSGCLHGDVSWPGVPGAVRAFLEKPVEMGSLEDALNTLLSRAGSRRPGECPT